MQTTEPKEATNPLLLAAIAERSSTHLLVYADWLEERGEPLAVGWRRLAESGKWPRHEEKDDWDWSDAARWEDVPRHVGDADNLPTNIYDCLRGFIFGGGGMVTYHSPVAALTAAARAFEQIAREQNDESSVDGGASVQAAAANREEGR